MTVHSITRIPGAGLAAMFTMAALFLPHAAESLEVRVLGTDGQPLKYAVVSVHSAAPETTLGAESTPDTAVMDQTGMQFTPHVLAIRKHTQVDFPNSDQVRHHVYSFSAAKRFELPLYADRPPSPIGFSATGPVVLGCNIHDHMIGYIYVVDSPLFARTSDDGTALFTGVPEQRDDLHLEIWHPSLKHDEPPHRRSLATSEPDQQLTIRLQVTDEPPPEPRGLRRGNSNLEQRFRRHERTD
ncbi:MAG: methylamine utilization protein [Aquisalimonadaceae bacterium]